MIPPTSLHYSPQKIIWLLRRVNNGTLTLIENGVQKEIRVHFDKLLGTGCIIWRVVVLSDDNETPYTIHYTEKELNHLIEEGTCWGKLDDYHTGPQVNLKWDEIPHKKDEEIGALKTLAEINAQIEHLHTALQELFHLVDVDIRCDGRTPIPRLSTLCNSVNELIDAYKCYDTLKRFKEYCVGKNLFVRKLMRTSPIFKTDVITDVSINGANKNKYIVSVQENGRILKYSFSESEMERLINGEELDFALGIASHICFVLTDKDKFYENDDE